MQRKWYELIPTTYIDEDREEGKYTTLYTDVWNFEIIKPLEELQKDIEEAKQNWNIFKYKKLDEYSKVLENYWELVLDLNNVKIMWFKEHHIIDDFKKARELSSNEELWLDKN